jgi:hypothetical protein
MDPFTYTDSPASVVLVNILDKQYPEYKRYIGKFLATTCAQFRAINPNSLVYSEVLREIYTARKEKIKARDDIPKIVRDYTLNVLKYIYKFKFSNHE